MYFSILKDFLFKLGLRDTTPVRDSEDISRAIFDNVWPIVCVDHSDGSSDGFAVFEGLYKKLGFELIPFVFIVPGDKIVYQLFGTAAGARGVLKKPLQPQEAAKLIRALVPPPNDAATSLAHQVTRLMLKGDVARSMPALAKLAQVPSHKRPAEVALARCEMKIGHVTQAQQRLGRLLQADGNDVRVMAELADCHRKNSQFTQAIALYRKIHSLHPQLHIKTWEQILLHVELDQLDEASLLLDELQGDPTFRDLSTEGLARLIHFLGLTQTVANVLKAQPEALKAYFSWISVHAQARG
jgi:tetratricopeptide (TPR) repeat protein